MFRTYHVQTVNRISSTESEVQHHFIEARSKNDALVFAIRRHPAAQKAFVMRKVPNVLPDWWNAYMYMSSKLNKAAPANQMAA